jgi:hypothetical protein
MHPIAARPYQHDPLTPPDTVPGPRGAPTGLTRPAKGSRRLAMCWERVGQVRQGANCHVINCCMVLKHERAIVIDVLSLDRTRERLKTLVEPITRAQSPRAVAMGREG